MKSFQRFNGMMAECGWLRRWYVC